MLNPSFLFQRSGRLVYGAFALFVGSFVCAQPRPVEIDDLLTLRRVTDHQVSRGGQRIAYVVTEVLKSENRTQADTWLVAADGSGEPKRLTHSPRHDLGSSH